MSAVHRAIHLVDKAEIVIVASDESNAGLARYRVDSGESAAECLADNGWTMTTRWEPVNRSAEACEVVRAREDREDRASAAELSARASTVIPGQPAERNPEAR